MSRTQLDWAGWVRKALGEGNLARRRVRATPFNSLESLEERALLSASSSLVGGRWTINADINPANPSEVIVVEQSPDDAGKVRVIINGTTIDDRSVKRLRSITVNAGAGDDTVNVQLPKTLGKVVVTINGGAGRDTLSVGGNRAILRGGDGDDILNGSEFADQLIGGRGDDVLNGNGGDDRLDGGEGEDNLRGGGGANRLTGGSGKDWIYMSSQTDRVTPDTSDIVGTDAQGGLQQFRSQAEFRDWLIHSAAVSQRLGRGGVYFVSADGPMVDTFSGTQKLNSPTFTDFSGTNTQVSGVDEQDIVETDGNYVYTVRGEELLIVDVRQPAASNIVSRTPLAGWGGQMYLDGDRLTVISSVNQWKYPGPVLLDSPVDAKFAAPLWNWRPQTQVITYDVSDRANPKLVEETTIDGGVSTSRSVDGRIYLVVDNNLWFAQPNIYYVKGAAAGLVPNGDSSAEYKDQLNKLDWTTVLPQFTTTSVDQAGTKTSTSGGLLKDDKIWAPNNPLDNSSFTSVVMIDIHHGGAGIDSSSTVFGINGEVYASTNALYLAGQDWSNVRWDGSSSSGPVTSLYKFDLTTDGSTLAATGKVDGTIVDQFSMDDHGGYFRIATTSNSFQADQSCNLFVLQQQGTELNVVSSLTGLSKGERIYSARFLGDHVYMSTFLQVDPLLSIDLTDPLAPVVTGELEVPGYSSYLQLWGDHLLVSIGQDADPLTGRVTGLQLSLFDITHGQKSQLVGTYKISVSAWSSYSQAQWEHHAFSLFDAQGILAIPVSNWDVDAGYSAELHVFQLDANKGFSLLGTVQHDSEVVRSLRIGDQLFSLSDSALKINTLINPAQAVASVPLADPNVKVDPPVVIAF